MLFPFICAVHISITLPYESSDTFVLISGFYYYYYFFFFYLGRGFLLIIIFFIVFIIILLLLIFFFFLFPFLVTAFAPLETEDSKKKKKKKKWDWRPLVTENDTHTHNQSFDQKCSLNWALHLSFFCTFFEKGNIKHFFFLCFSAFLSFLLDLTHIFLG